MMNKADLRTGMVVELRNGTRYLVLCGDMTMSAYGKQSIIFITNDEQWGGTAFYDDLRSSYDKKEYDVVKVFSGNVDNLISTFDTKELLWTRQPEVDWSKVAVGTKVYIRDHEDVPWAPRYFCKYQDGKVYTWNCGVTSFTKEGNDYYMGWNHAKLA